MAGPGRPTHDPPEGDHETLSEEEESRIVGRPKPMRALPTGNDQQARKQIASQELGNAVVAAESNNNLSANGAAERSNAPPSPTLSEKEAYEQMMYDLGNHRVNELKFDDDSKRSNVNKSNFSSKPKPSAIIVKGPCSVPNFGKNDGRNDVANAYNKLAAENREKDDPTLKGLDEIGGDEYRENMRRQLAAENGGKSNRKENSFFAEKCGYTRKRGGSPAHRGRGGLTVRERTSPNKYSPRPRSASPSARRRTSLGSKDASNLRPPPPIDPELAAQLAEAKAFSEQVKAAKGPGGRGKSFVPRGNIGKHVVVSPRAAKSPAKVAPSKPTSKLPPAPKPVSERPRPVSLAARIPPASNGGVGRHPVSTTFDKNWFQNAAALAAKKTGSNKASLSNSSQRHSSAPSSAGSVGQAAHQRAPSSSSRGTNLVVHTASIHQQAPEEEIWDDLYDVSPRSRVRPPPNDARILTQPSLPRANSNSSHGTDLNVTSRSVPEVPPPVPEEPEEEAMGPWTLDRAWELQCYGASEAEAHDWIRPRMSAESAPPTQPDLLSLCGSSVPTSSPRRPNQELMELEDLQWIDESSIAQPDFGPVNPSDDEIPAPANGATQHNDLSGGRSSDSSLLMSFSSPQRNSALQSAVGGNSSDGNVVRGGFDMPPSLMDHSFEMDRHENTPAVEMNNEAAALSPPEAVHPALTGHGIAPAAATSRRIVYSADEMMALRGGTGPELVVDIVDHVKMVRKLAQAEAALDLGGRTDAEVNADIAEYNMGLAIQRAEAEDKAAERALTTPVVNQLPRTTSNANAAPQPAVARKASGGLGQSRWASPPKNAAASASIPASTTSLTSATTSTPRRNLSGGDMLGDLVTTKKLGGLAASKYADGSSEDEKSKKTPTTPARPVRRPPLPSTPTRGGGSSIQQRSQAREPSRGRGRGRGNASPATAKAVDENVSPFERRSGRRRGGFGGDGADEDDDDDDESPSPETRRRRGSMGPMIVPAWIKRQLDNGPQDAFTARVVADTEYTGRHPLANITSRSRANPWAVPAAVSPKRRAAAHRQTLADVDPVSWQQTLLADAQAPRTQHQLQPQHGLSVGTEYHPFHNNNWPFGPPQPSQVKPAHELGTPFVLNGSQVDIYMLTGHAYIPEVSNPTQVRRVRCLVHGAPWVDNATATVRANIKICQENGEYIGTVGSLDGPPFDGSGNRWFADLFAVADEISRHRSLSSNGFLTPTNIPQPRLNSHGYIGSQDPVWAGGYLSTPAPAAPMEWLGMAIVTDQRNGNRSFVPSGPVDLSHALRFPNPSLPLPAFATAPSSPERPSRVSRAIPIRRPEDAQAPAPPQLRPSSAGVAESSTTSRSQSSSSSSMSARSAPFIPRTSRPSAAIPIRPPGQATVATSAQAGDTSTIQSNNIRGSLPYQNGSSTRPSRAIPIRRPEDATVAGTSQPSPVPTSPSLAVAATVPLVDGVIAPPGNDTPRTPPARPVRQPRGPAEENNFATMPRLPRDNSPHPATLQQFVLPTPARSPERVLEPVVLQPVVLPPPQREERALSPLSPNRLSYNRSRSRLSNRASLRSPSRLPLRSPSRSPDRGSPRFI